MQAQNFYPTAGYPQPQPYGYNAGMTYVNRPVANYTQPLTKEQIESLRSKSDNSFWTVTNEDILKSICTHKENGVSTLNQQADGSMVCSICGSRFRSFDGSPEEVEEAVNKVLDILQTSKTLYLDIPENFVKNYYQYIPLLKKLPAVFQKSAENFEKYTMDPYAATRYMGGQVAMNTWGMFNQFMGGPGAMGAFQQPVYAPQGYQPQAMPAAPAAGYPMPQAMPAAPAAGYQPAPMGYYPAPMQQPQYQANPFAYGAPGAMPVPEAPVAPVAPAAPAAPTAEIKQTETFNA